MVKLLLTLPQLDPRSQIVLYDMAYAEATQTSEFSPDAAQSRRFLNLAWRVRRQALAGFGR